jgi:hypothetical protein
VGYQHRMKISHPYISPHCFGPISVVPRREADSTQRNGATVLPWGDLLYAWKPNVFGVEGFDPAQESNPRPGPLMRSKHHLQIISRTSNLEQLRNEPSPPGDSIWLNCDHSHTRDPVALWLTVCRYVGGTVIGNQLREKVHGALSLYS